MDIEKYRRPLREGLSEVEIEVSEEQLDFLIQQAKDNNKTIDEVVEDIVRDKLNSINIKET